MLCSAPVVETELSNFGQNTNFAKLPSGKMAFFDITVNFITQKLKSKHLAISVFSGQRFFEGTRGNIFHISRD